MTMSQSMRKPSEEPHEAPWIAAYADQTPIQAAAEPRVAQQRDRQK